MKARPAFAMVLCGALLVALSAVSARNPMEAGSLPARLQARLDALEALRGRFVQTLDSRSLGRARRESGTFAIRKPAFMRWEYLDPEAKLAITDGTDTWLYLPEDREVRVGTLDDREGAAAAMLLTGRARLDRDFSSRILDGPGAGREAGAAGPDSVILELTPLRTTEEYDRLLLSVDPVRLLVRRLTMVDALGGTMTFDFMDLEENVPLPDELFRFEAPPGVEVIDERSHPATRD